MIVISNVKQTISESPLIMGEIAPISPLFTLPAEKVGDKGATISILLLNCVGEILTDIGPNGEKMLSNYGFGIFWPAFTLIVSYDGLEETKKVRDDLIAHWEAFLK